MLAMRGGDGEGKRKGGGRINRFINYSLHGNGGGVESIDLSIIHHMGRVGGGVSNQLIYLSFIIWGGREGRGGVKH